MRSKTSNKKKMLECNYRCSILSTDFPTNCVTNTSVLITLENTNAEKIIAVLWTKMEKF